MHVVLSGTLSYLYRVLGDFRKSADTRARLFTSFLHFCLCSIGTKHSYDITSDVVLTKNVWERIQTRSHFKTASNSF